MVRMSKTSKLGGILSWSLEAVKTCPGAIGPDKLLVDGCAGCYATTGFYNMPTTQDLRIDNKELWKDPGWVDAMVAALNNERWFRWFDSGDVYHPRLAEKIYLVILMTPWCSHWLPTKSYKVGRIMVVLEQIKKLPNVAVRYSSDSIHGDFEDGLHGSTIIPDNQPVPAGVTPCSAVNHKCGQCRDCWDTDVKVIGYQPIGKVKTRLNKEASMLEVKKEQVA